MAVVRVFGRCTDHVSGRCFSGRVLAITAAIILLDEWLSDDVMQFAAAENNLNEIAFAKLNGPPWDFGDSALNCGVLIKCAVKISSFLSWQSGPADPPFRAEAVKSRRSGFLADGRPRMCPR
jgi:hypothetical protein